MIAAAFLVLWPAAVLRVDVSVDLHVAMGQYFHAAPSVVTHLHTCGVSDDEIPVVLFLSTHGKVEPTVILDLRRKGLSWMDISVHFRLDAGAFYVPLATTPGPPYGHAYGYYKNRPRKDWSAIVLSDDDLTLLVNLRFLSDHFQVEPDLVVQMGGKHRGLPSLHASLKGHKEAGLGAAGPKGPGKESGAPAGEKGAGKQPARGKGKGGKGR